ncbi:MAG TPA: hypothetical protein VFA87_10860 [Rhizomicrobium sp.]|nr:hypothetical protein [Rhizomicrobium sp.]
MPATILLATTMGWPFPAQLAGAFAGAGAQVQTLAPASAMLARSRHPMRHHLYSSLAPMDCLTQAMATAKLDLIVPCDDLAARLVAQVQGEPLPGRLDFLRRAAEAGANVAATEEIGSEDDLEPAIAKLGLPLVLKLDHSWGGEGVLIAESRQEAVKAFRRLGRQSRFRNIFRALRGRGAHFLTQALYPVSPRISAQHFISGMAATSSVACWRGKVVASHHFDVRVSTTPTSPASVIAVSDCRQMEAAAETVARAFHLSGLFGLDYIRDRSGQVHLLEMNRRATPTMHLALEQDLTASLLRAAGFAASFRPPVTDKKLIALFPREWMRDPASPWLSRSYHDVPWDDPEVFRACVQVGSAEARARLQPSSEAALTTEKAIFGG